MALPQQQQHYRGLVELIAASVVRRIEAERENAGERAAEVRRFPIESCEQGATTEGRSQ